MLRRGLAERAARHARTLAFGSPTKLGGAEEGRGAAGREAPEVLPADLCAASLDALAPGTPLLLYPYASSFPAQGRAPLSPGAADAAPPVSAGGEAGDADWDEEGEGEEVALVAVEQDGSGGVFVLGAGTAEPRRVTIGDIALAAAAAAGPRVWRSVARAVPEGAMALASPEGRQALRQAQTGGTSRYRALLGVWSKQLTRTSCGLCSAAAACSLATRGSRRVSERGLLAAYGAAARPGAPPATVRMRLAGTAGLAEEEVALPPIDAAVLADHGVTLAQVRPLHTTKPQT
jgi:hypothetical protein